jgi:hypothetical protein
MGMSGQNRISGVESLQSNRIVIHHLNEDQNPDSKIRLNSLQG